MKIGIIGTGSMASFYAASLAPWHEITMIGTWKEQIDTVNNFGLDLEKDGIITNFDIKAIHYENIKEQEDFDLLFILIKNYQNKQAIKFITKCVSSKTILILLQNGGDNLAFFQNHFKLEQLFLASTTQAALIKKPGLVTHTGQGIISIPSDHPESLQTQNLFKIIGFDVRMGENIQHIIWQKLIINACINPLTALLNVNNGFLVSNDNCLSIIKEINDECYLIAKAIGLINFENPYHQVLNVAKKTSNNSSSMRNDIINGKRTEVDGIMGYMLRQAKITGVHTPLLQQITTQIKRLENKEIESGIEQLNALLHFKKSE